MATHYIDDRVESTCEAVVKESTRITPASAAEVRHILLGVEDPGFNFLEGQSIAVLVPGPHAFGNKYHVRR